MFGMQHHCLPLSQNGEDDSFATNKDYLFAFDLFNAGYYWESHVWWEELWHLAKRKGELADLLKALIKLAAAGVKLKLKHRDPTRGHLERAKELIGPLATNHRPYFYGIDLKQLQSDIEALILNPDNLLSYSIKLKDIANII